ncbi:MAG: response regulator, partial [Candidatus Hydrogenedentes bacterium]|nr:response regulator [Candidatus Hydrogenedentota bacterium]
FTAARKTAEGVNRAVQVLWQPLGRSSVEDTVIQALEQFAAGTNPDLQSVVNALHRETELSEETGAFYSLYDAYGTFLVNTGDMDPEDKVRPDWPDEVTHPQFVDLAHLAPIDRWAVQSAAPVHNLQTGDLLGFLSKTEDIQDLLEFVLGGEQSNESGLIRSGLNQYQIAYFGEQGRYLVRLQDENAQRRLVFEEMDERLAQRIHQSESPGHDSLTLWQYNMHGDSGRVLLAYHQLFNQDIYVIVYRPMSEVFSNVNRAAMLSIVVTSLVIGFFVVVTYRFVNNNIIRPVSLLNEGAQIIRQGDLELKLVIGTGDEIEELASSFNKMATALRHNINQLEESEEKYRNLINSMRDGIFQTNADGGITFINPAGVEILGYKSAQDVIGTNLRELFIEQIDFARVTNELAKHRFIERTRIWMRKAGGRSICVELSSNRVYDEARGLLGMEGTFRDVTQNVRLEQEARERSERIAAINQIANAINSSLEAGRVYESIVVEVRKLVNFDFAAVSLLNPDGAGFVTRQLWPEPLEEHEPPLRAGIPESCAAWVGRERRCLIVDRLRDGQQPFAADFPDEIQSCLCVPLYATGRIIGSLNLGARDTGVFTKYEAEVLEQMVPHVAVAIRNAQLLENLQHSLEEVTRAREKLHEANEELKTLDEMKTNLLSNVSHELRTPLVAVMGYTDMILNRKAGPINEMQEEYLGISLRNIEKLVTLIENLLDFSRLHRGTEEIVFDTLDLVDCARTSIQIVKPLADGREIDIILNTPGEEVPVEGDKGKLGQVFNNLLSNAAKFNHPGGKIIVDIKPSEDVVDVTVSDTGIGIPEEALDKIFTRFYQYDGSSTRKYGGTGIGLSIAQDIMRLHGSRITVTSKVGQGSQFRFTLPLGNIVRQTREGTAQMRLPTETHLLVELVSQDRALSAQIRNMLISEGMDVIHAAYPAAAISLAGKYSPDCLVVDTEAGPTGSVVLEEILSDPAASQLPVVLLTNDDDLYRRYRGQVAGRVRRGFRKSMLLSGIHYALSKGLAEIEQLGNKVLCVDDDQEIVTFTTRCLEAEGLETDQCASGEEALERLKSGDYWLVLLDVAMPGLDGWETCARIKGDPALRGVLVYFVTAKPIDKSLSRVQECGADGYLLKPFKAEDLLALVQGFESRLATKQS